MDWITSMVTWTCELMSKCNLTYLHFISETNLVHFSLERVGEKLLYRHKLFIPLSLPFIVLKIGFKWGWKQGCQAKENGWKVSKQFTIKSYFWKHRKHSYILLFPSQSWSLFPFLPPPFFLLLLVRWSSWGLEKGNHSHIQEKEWGGKLQDSEPHLCALKDHGVDTLGRYVKTHVR